LKNIEKEIGFTLLIFLHNKRIIKSINYKTISTQGLAENSEQVFWLLIKKTDELEDKS
jgi:hypothetical protein